MRRFRARIYVRINYIFMKINDILLRLGFSKHEATLYEMLVQTGPATISTLAEKAKMHRPLVYEALPGLLKRGLIAFSVKGKRRIFVAEPPEKLKALVSNVAADIDTVLPQLKSMYRSKETIPIFRIVEGKQGITELLDDVVDSLPRGGTFYRYSSIENAERGNRYLSKDYRERRDQKQLQRFVITNEGVAKQKQNRMDRAMRVLPMNEKAFSFGVTEIIYGKKVAYIDYNTETALVIENEKIAEFQKTLFMSLYQRLS